MKEPRKAAKEGGDDPMKDMRERYDRITDIERTNRNLAVDDLRFVAVPGSQWDEQAKKARKNRPCYEFPILRSHWRQVVNDQKKARPAIKVRGLRDATVEGAELRQGLIRNIESVSNAAYAYDAAFELLVAAGMGAWRVTTKYSEDDGWEQDFAIEPIKDALNSVWMDEEGQLGFVEESISREEFKARWPKADAIDFDSALNRSRYGSWCGERDVRIAEYWRLVPVDQTICLLSDGRSVSAEEWEPVQDEEAANGVTCTRTRTVKTHKVVMSIVSGAEELDGPHESVFHSIPIVLLYANRHFVDGKWHWMGMVRPSRDPQKLVNYNFTAGQEALAKQHKSTPIVTPAMLEGAGVKAMWDASNSADTPYLPITPDPLMPGGPHYLTAPPIHSGFFQMGQLSVDMLKASDGIYDASVGARSNETSGRAINARREEGDTATFDYQDKLAEGIQTTGQLIGKALHKVYDTQRVVRVIGKDGGDTWQTLYEQVRDEQTGEMKVINDLSEGKYDYTVTTGASYDTQRMEFADALTNLSQGNPQIGAVMADLLVGAMDFPKAEEAAERLKLMLPPQIQQAIAENKKGKVSPEVQQMQGQMQQMQQMAEQHIQAMQEEMQKLQAKAESKDDSMLKAQVAQHQSMIAEKELELKWYQAETDRIAALQQNAQAAAQLDMDAARMLDERMRAEAGEAEAANQPEAEPAQPAMSPEELKAMLADHHAQVANTLTQSMAAMQSRPRKTTVVRDAQGNIVGAESE